jgi:hypothetical protein
MVGVMPYFWNPIQHVEPADDSGFRRFMREFDLFQKGRVMGKQMLLPPESVERKILLIRGEKILLDADLAELYGVSTKRLNEAVKRNRERFPVDFMFQLEDSEVADLRSQIATSSLHGGRRTLPYAFTEQGVAMLSSVLRSKRAVQVNVQIMRTFVRLRQLLSSNAGLSLKLSALEKKYDGQFKIVFDAIRLLMSEQELDRRERSRKKIGYHAETENRA